MNRQKSAIAASEVSSSLQNQVELLETEVRYLKEKNAIGRSRDESSLQNPSESPSVVNSNVEIPGLVEFQKRRDQFSDHERRLQLEISSKIKVDLALQDSHAMSKELKIARERLFQLESELRQERSMTKKQHLLFKDMIDSIRSDMAQVRQEAVDLCVQRELQLHVAETTIESLKLAEESAKKNVSDLLRRLEEQEMKFLRVEEDTIAKYTMLAFQEKESIEKKEKLFMEIEVQSKQVLFEKNLAEKKAQQLHEQCLTLIREKDELVKAHTLSKVTLAKEREEREKIRKSSAEFATERVKLRQEAANGQDKVILMDKLLKERDDKILSLQEYVTRSTSYMDSFKQEREKYEKERAKDFENIASVAIENSKLEEMVTVFNDHLKAMENELNDRDTRIANLNNENADLRSKLMTLAERVKSGEGFPSAISKEELQHLRQANLEVAEQISQMMKSITTSTLVEPPQTKSKQKI